MTQIVFLIRGDPRKSAANIFVALFPHLLRVIRLTAAIELAGMFKR
ncbi:MAG TPA: hypothetical protein VF435_18310 [Pyrinomonadaceae bacterium]